LPLVLQPWRRPSPGTSPVHTRPFAFRTPQADDESVKISNITNGRSSALPSEFSTGRPCASDHAPSTVILLALSVFCEGSPPPVPRVGPAAAGISPSFSVPSAFLCVLSVKSFAFRSAACPQNRQFLFNTNDPPTNFATRTKQTTSFFLSDANECVSRTSNLATHTKQTTSSQITSFFLFDTNERSPITTHQSLLTTHDSTKLRHAASPLRRGLVAVMLRRDFRGVTCD